jgi:SAM-dependent methyltransferase
MQLLSNGLRLILTHPLTRGRDIDDPDTTHLRQRILTEKAFLRRLYQEWYQTLANSLPEGTGSVLELGSGAGFLSDFIPGLLTSEVFPCAGVRYVLDAHALPFEEGELRGIVMTDVLHHLSRVRTFFHEATRCVRRGGVISMIEPWVTAWSSQVYTRLHHEPFLPNAVDWHFPSTGPLSAANGALPWILFMRDRKRFEDSFPNWTIERIAPTMPISYLVSGGISLRSFMPGWSYPLWRSFERLLSPFNNQLAMFAHVVLRRR